MKNAYELAENILKSKPDKNIELKSSDSFASIELYGTSACKKVQDTEFCECFHLENESGTGMITLYHVFPVSKLPHTLVLMMEILMKLFLPSLVIQVAALLNTVLTIQIGNLIVLLLPP